MEAGADINARNYLGRSILHIFLDTFQMVSPRTHIDSLVYFLTNGADPHAIDFKGHTVTDIAYNRSYFSRQGCWKCLNLLCGNCFQRRCLYPHVSGQPSSCVPALKLAGYRAELWDLALYICGVEVQEVRGHHQCFSPDNGSHSPPVYSQQQFEELWQGREGDCLRCDWAHRSLTQCRCVGGIIMDCNNTAGINGSSEAVDSNFKRLMS